MSQASAEATTLACEGCGRARPVTIEMADGTSLTGAQYIELTHLAGRVVLCEECADGVEGPRIELG